MEISIGELQSTVTTSGAPLLDPAVLERIVEAVLTRLTERQEQDQRARASRQLLDLDDGGWR